jgi:putative transposase
MSRPSRIQHFDYRGIQRYFVTCCTFERAHTLGDDATASLVLVSLRRTAGLTDFAIFAYCVMPDHVHLLVEGTTGASDFTRFMKSLKQSSGQAYSRRTGRRLWQEGYYERVLRPHDDAKDVARYIVGNPVRALLARSPLEYPFVGSDVWALDDLVETVAGD